MLRFRLGNWRDGEWAVGRLPQVPGVFSQGASLDELEENIRDAYQLMTDEQSRAAIFAPVETKEIEVRA
jgi:predicted RNase H-like HicB family nuclease